MEHQEDIKVSEPYRKAYLDSLQSTIKNMSEESVRRRAAFVKGMKGNLEEYRKKYLNMLGYPLNLSAIDRTPPKVKRELVASDDFCKMYRITINTFASIQFYGLLLIPHSAKNAPLVIAQHGGWGTPELCCDMHGENNYTHMAQRSVAAGAVVFAPQQLLWNIDNKVSNAPIYGVTYDRDLLDKKLKHYGSSLLAIEIYNLMRAIDYLVTLEEVDGTHIGMLGLSYGGFYTLYTMAAEPRIRVGYSSSFFNDRSKYEQLDWTWHNSGNMFHDAEVACLCADRHICIEVGKTDNIFTCETALEEYQRLENYLKYLGLSDHVLFNVWEGGHKISMGEREFGFFLKHL